MQNKRPSNKFWRVVVGLIVLLLVAIFLVVAWPTLQNYRETELWRLLSERSGGVIAGMLGSILGGILSNLLADKLVGGGARRLILPIVEKMAATAQAIQDRLQAAAQTLLGAVGTQTRRTIVAISSAIYGTISVLSASIHGVLSIFWSMVATLVNKLNAPKWYHNNVDAIDPGLIEVSLAVTAVLIALPSLVEQSIPAEQASLMNTFRFLGEAIPTITSISLLDRYAKNKGAKSIHILLSPIEDGPFFFLGWSIFIGFVLISVIAFQFG